MVGVGAKCLAYAPALPSFKACRLCFRLMKTAYSLGLASARGTADISAAEIEPSWSVSSAATSGLGRMGPRPPAGPPPGWGLGHANSGQRQSE